VIIEEKAMRSRLGMASLVLVVLTGAAFAKGPKMALPLVPAQCAGAVPCSPDFAFKSGVAVLTAAKEPAPTCPKTGRPSETPGGTVRLSGVSLRGAAYTGALTVEVTNQTTFGSDGGDCSLNALQITTPTLQGTLSCKAGRCKGVVLPIACLPAECADVPVTTEFQLLEVLDAPTLEGGKAIARPGFFVAPLR
jgi:hypothetical protein